MKLKDRALSIDETDMLYKLANFAEDHGPDKWAIARDAVLRRIGGRLLSRGYVIKGDMQSGEVGFRLTQTGYDMANELWAKDPNNPDRQDVTP